MPDFSEVLDTLAGEDWDSGQVKGTCAKGRRPILRLTDTMWRDLENVERCEREGKSPSVTTANVERGRLYRVHPSTAAGLVRRGLITEPGKGVRLTNAGRAVLRARRR